MTAKYNHYMINTYYFDRSKHNSYYIYSIVLPIDKTNLAMWGLEPTSLVSVNRHASH